MTIHFPNVKFSKDTNNITDYAFWGIKEGKDNQSPYIRIGFALTQSFKDSNWDVSFKDDSTGTIYINDLSSKRNELPKNLLRSFRIQGNILLSEEYVKNIKDTQTKKLVQKMKSRKKAYYPMDSENKILLEFFITEVLKSQNFNRTITNSVNVDTFNYNRNAYRSSLYSFTRNLREDKIFRYSSKNIGYDSFIGYELLYNFDTEIEEEADKIIIDTLTSWIPDVEIESSEEDYDEGFEDLDEALNRGLKVLTKK